MNACISKILLKHLEKEIMFISNDKYFVNYLRLRVIIIDLISITGGDRQSAS